MARRHDGLLPLTHDHHHALRHARLLRAAADGSDAERLVAVRSFVDFFETESVQHFREEEEQIFPLVAEHPEAPWSAIERVLREHVTMHAGVRRLKRSLDEGSVSGDAMRSVADVLKAHVRFEEDELFPAIERLADEDLRGVSLPKRDRSLGGEA